VSETVWKYEMLDTEQAFEMPAGARVLDVAAQDGKPCLWAQVDPARAKEWRSFVLVGTGIAMQGPLGTYVGTAHNVANLGLVMHVFEVADRG